MPSTFLLIKPEKVIADIPNTNDKPTQGLTAFTQQTFKGVTNVTCFVGPDAAYKVIYNSLAKCSVSFYLEVYTLSSEPLVNGLIAAHGRGVDVQVSLSHDRVNSYEDDYTEEAAYRLDQAGVNVTWSSSGFAYTHAKFWIVDHEVSFVYSGNWAPSSIPQYEGARTNRELGYAFNDTAIATYYEGIFFDDQAIGNPYQGTEPHLGNLQANETSGTYAHPFDEPYTTVEYMEVTPIFSPNNSYTLLKSLIDNATVSLDISQQYINFDCALLNDTIEAAKRGVIVRVLIPEPDSSSQNVTEELITNNVQVRFFDGLGHNHNKYVSADGKITAVSSINWSNNSVDNNREAGAVVNNSNVADYFKTVFDYDWVNSEIPPYSTPPIWIIDPDSSAVATGTSYEVSVGFNTYTYLSGELYIDGVKILTWTTPSEIVTHSFDTNTYSDGIHKVTVIGEPDSGPNITEHTLFNIINRPDWLVLLSEVRWDAGDEPEGEFFEMYNAFNFDVAIGGWEVTDNEDDFKFLANTNITAGEALIFASNEDTFIYEMGLLGITGITPDFIFSNLLLANTGDEIVMSTPEGVVEAVAWGSGSAPSTITWSGSYNNLTSLQRDPANEDTDDCTVDFRMGTPTPGDVNVTVDNTPPSVDSPPDDSYLLGETGNTITWTVSDPNNDTYIVYRNGVNIQTNDYISGTVLVDIDGLAEGVYNFTIWLSDYLGHTSTDTVWITVIDPTIPLVIVTPEENDVASGTYVIEVSFNKYTYTTGELFINNTLIHTWTNPSGSETYSLVTTNGYVNGIHDLKVIATRDTSDTITIEYEFNIINVDDWLLLISEVHIDAVTEPTGEFFELYNGFDCDVAIGGWELTDGEDSYYIPDDTTFDAGDILIFVRDVTVYNSEMATLGVTAYTPDFIYTHIEFSNTGDSLTLKTATEDIDEVAWGSVTSTVTPWTGTMDDTLSLQREPADKDTDDCSVDFIADTPNPGVVYITATTSETPGFTCCISIFSASVVALILRRIRKR
ncbi:MAG: lamin tail domain-containing protein [Candidatus Heimdallarchaeota archaeon]